MPKDVEVRLADGVRLAAEVGGTRVPLTPDQLRALACVLEGRHDGRTGELRSLFAAGVLDLGRPRAPTLRQVEDLLAWPDGEVLYLDPRAEISVALFEGSFRPLYASMPLALFIPPAVGASLAGLARRLRTAARAMHYGAGARGQTIAPEEWARAVEPIYRHAAGQPPLTDYLRIAEDPETVFRAEWLRPLQEAACSYGEARIRFTQSDRPDAPVPLRLATAALPALAGLIRRLHHGIARSDLVERIGNAADPLALYNTVEAVSRCGLLTTAAPSLPAWDDLLPPDAALAALHLGHAGLLLRGGSARVAVDPWFVAGAPKYAVQPLAGNQLPPLDAVLVTHDHYDHIDFPTLLQYPPGVPVIVPRQPASIPLQARYREFLELAGCDNVIELDHWQRHELPDGLTITAVPFTGEGTADDGVVRNCYLAERHGRRVFVHVDSSIDSLGQSDLTDGTIDRVVAEHGPIDVLYATRRQELHLGHEIVSDLDPVFLGADPRRFAAVLENCYCPAAYIAALAEATSSQQVVLYSEGGAEWFPDDTNFMRADEASFAGHEYLWDPLEAFVAAIPVPVHLSKALDAVVLGEDGIEYRRGPIPD